MRIAAGAPALADKTKAALLPVFTTRRADGSFLTRISPPLMAGIGNRGKEAEREFAEFYGALATDMATLHPAQISYCDLRLEVTPPDTASAPSPPADQRTANAA